VDEAKVKEGECGVCDKLAMEIHVKINNYCITTYPPFNKYCKIWHIKKKCAHCIMRTVYVVHKQSLFSNDLQKLGYLILRVQVKKGFVF